MVEKNSGKEGGDFSLEETIEGGWTIWILLLPGVPAVRSQLGRVRALQGPHPRESMNCLFRERTQDNVISDSVP